MKTNRQRKGKTAEAPQKHVGSPKCTGVKKPANRSRGPNKKATAQVLGQQLPSSSKSSTETTKKTLASELKPGQINPSPKIKLQLFPIDEYTWIRLQKEGHNPFLELTLRARKKISSVLTHINTKWASLSKALGEPILFPYNVRFENLATCRGWTLKDAGISAGDVYATLESPDVFRLRYGWFSNGEPKRVPAASTPFDCLESVSTKKGCNTQSELTYDGRKQSEVSSGQEKWIDETADAVMSEQIPFDVAVDHVDAEVKIDNILTQSMAPRTDSRTDLSIGSLLPEASLQDEIDNRDLKSNGSRWGLLPIPLVSDISIGGLLSEASLQEKIENHDLKSSASRSSLLSIPLISDISIGGLLSEASLQGRVGNHESVANVNKLGVEQSPFQWDDSLTTLSIGGLLFEGSLLHRINNCDPKSNEVQPSTLTSDSFNPVIVAQMNCHPQAAKPSSHDSHSSILDAEETCHAFSFRKFSSSGKNVRVSGRTDRDSSSNSLKFPNFSELSEQAGLAEKTPCQKLKTQLLPHPQVYNEDSSSSLGLRGINWNESLGPFDLGLSTLQQVSGGGDSISVGGII